MKTCIITALQNKGWILDRIGKVVGDCLEHQVVYSYDPLNSKDADNYFITHYSLIDSFPHDASKCVVFFTHESFPLEKVAKKLNACLRVICASWEQYEHLVSEGVSRDKISVIPEGADPEMFTPHKRSDQGVLLSGSFYQRKNPMMIMNVVLNSPRNFTLLGKGWNSWQFFSNLVNLKNFKYVEAVYDEYPSIYTQHDVFLSCSTLEGGGPNGLIEAMHSNLVPVVTDTGNAQEYIINGYNGFILPTKAKPEQFIDCIENAYKLTDVKGEPVDVSKTVEFFTWENFANEISQYLSPQQA